jgi:hypothetical protein
MLEEVAMQFGLISNGGKEAQPTTWHALKPQGDGWTTVCTAMSARPGMKVVAIASEPGQMLCQLKRCRVAVEGWKSAQTGV